MTSKIVSLKEIKESSFNGKVYPSEKKQIAWAGGVITTNKQKMALKFIEKKKQSGEELTERIFQSEDSSSKTVVKESTPENKTIKIKVPEPDFSHRFSESSSSIDSLLSSDSTSKSSSVFSRLGGGGGKSSSSSSSKSESTLNTIFGSINSPSLKVNKDMNITVTVGGGKTIVEKNKPLKKSPIKIKQPSPRPDTMEDKGKPVLTEKLGSFLERHTLEGITKPTKRSYEYNDEDDRTNKRIHYLGPKKTKSVEKPTKINLNISPMFRKYDASNKRKSFTCSTNQFKKLKTDSYDINMFNDKINYVYSKNNPTKRKNLSENVEVLEYEPVITTKRNLTELIHSITHSENKKTPMNNICVFCKAPFNDNTAIHICNFVELDNLNKFFIHSYCCMMCYGRFKCRSDEECSEQYLCDDCGVYIDSL